MIATTNHAPLLLFVLARSCNTPARLAHQLASAFRSSTDTLPIHVLLCFCITSVHNTTSLQICTPSPQTVQHQTPDKSSVCTGEPDAQSLSIQTIISSALAGPQHGPAAQATADLLLSCLQGKPSPAQELADTLHAFLGLPIPDASHSQAPHEDIATNGAASGVLLVQRLLQTVVQHPSQVLNWRHQDLDSLACHLVKVGDSIPASESPAPADNHRSGFQAESGRPEADNTAADTASLAESVASAPLDPSEQTAAAQESPFSETSHELAKGALQQAGGGVQDISSSAQLLGVLICGKGNVSLLTDRAIQQVLCHFKASLESTEKYSGMMILQRQAPSPTTCL